MRIKIIKKIKEAIKDLVCPPATQDLELNTNNRDSAIQSEHVQYGPLNLDDESYWVRVAEHWKTTPEVAKESNCSNCAAFDISPRMEECMPGSLQEDGRLGYCWMHNFKCHSARTCYTWAGGGPISEDKVSAEWQERNMKNLQEKDDRCTRIAKRKYDVWPSAYASGAVVKCRKGKIWKGLKESGVISEDTEESLFEKINNILENDSLDEKKKKAGTESSKENSLRDWFGRKGAKGKSGGWVDCNTCRKDKKSGRKTCKSCGRKEGEKRSKYPSCRPTPGACGEKGKGKSWGKKSANENYIHITEASLDDGTIIEDLEFWDDVLEEAEYQGRKVTLNKPTRGDVKKFKVYVKDPKTGNVKKVNFGDPNMRIKKSNPKRRKSFRARHNCDNPGPKTKARYWSCKKW